MKSAATIKTTSGKFLRDVFLEKVERNPSYSLRAMARKLGVSHAYLSQVMNGKKALPLKRVLQFTQILGLDEATTKKFIASATLTEEMQLNQTNSKPSRKPLDDGVDGEFHILEIDRFKTLSQWHHIAILDLTEVKGFRSDVKWIARKLGITTFLVNTALERLERLGLIENKNGQWCKTHSKLMMPGTAPERAVREFHCQMMRKALEAHEQASNTGYEKRDFTGTTMAINPALVPEAKKRIAKFRRQLMKFLSQGDCTSLYQLNVQLFCLAEADESQTIGSKKV